MNTGPRQIRLIMELRADGISDPDVLGAIERTPRERFIPEQFRDRAYENTALPIGEGQTISQPFIVGLMTQSLELNKRAKVLEIGTGCGYQAAILSQLCRRVYTIERHRSLARNAGKLLQELGYTNVVTMVGDGTKGWPEQAPFDRIIATAAAADTVPQALFEQLADGGILVAPVGDSPYEQYLWRYRKNGEEIGEERLCAVRFVPLVRE
ncbi:MAG: protein-L-isoaspartate(D-aspartate) O-methyltransferase [Alphaproteobacteria bacterium]|nr:protein-L-isoaspartate(D-aspartate) O-methyltransferase [Alphaproteobacteria bacterium]